jgi:hypothetical protein
MFGILGLVINNLKVLENIFPMVYYMPPNVLKLQLQNKKQKFVVV